MASAYSHEVASCGYWPGGADEGVFYAYTYPEPVGYRTRPVNPMQATYEASLGEFVLPYADVRRSSDPRATLMSFYESTYDAAAAAGGWDPM
jgi:hypothetical protein